MGVLGSYREARFLASRLERVASIGEKAIEEALREDREHKDLEIRQKFKQVPAYLRDLIFIATREHIHRPDPHLELVRKLLSDNPHEVLFIVLNYDDLLEIALTQYSSARFGFSLLPGYVRDDQAKVIPLHGSIHWFKRFERTAGGSDWAHDVLKTDVLEEVEESDMLVAQGVSSTTSPRDGGDSAYYLYPLVTMPVAGKTITDIRSPGSFMAVAREFLSDCHKFLIIGTSGLDTDLFEVINTGAQDTLPDPIVRVVGVKSKVTDTFKNLYEQVDYFEGRIDPDVSIYEKGFYNYVFSAGLDEFATSGE